MHRRSRNERGSALVEAALVTPLFFLVIFGVFEFGLVFRQYLTVVNTTRNTARAATVTGNNVDSDYRILQEFARSSKAIKQSEIQFMVIYKAPTVDADPETTPSLSGCLVASVPGKCNRYTVADLARPSTDFTGLVGAPDAAWPPASRVVSLAGPPDNVGVFLHTRHDASSNAFGISHDFTDSVVYRIEPQTR